MAAFILHRPGAPAPEESGGHRSVGQSSARRRTGGALPPHRRAVVAAAAAIVLWPLGTGLWPATPASATGPASPVGYVANYGGNTVTAFNTATTNTVSTITVGSNPTGVAVSPDGTTAWVANEGSNSVSVIDTASNTVTHTIPVGTSPSAIAINPAGTLVYVANYDDNTVTQIRASTFAVMRTIQVGSHPDGIAITPNSSWVYVANAGDNSVTAILSPTPMATIAVGPAPWSMAVTPDGATVYVANSANNTVTGIRTSDNTVVSTIAAAPGPGTWAESVAVSPDGQTLYVGVSLGTGDGQVVPFDLHTTPPTAGTPFGVANHIPTALAVSSNGQMLWVACGESGNLWAMSTSTKTLTDVVITGSSPWSIAVQPDQAPVAHFSITPAAAGAPSGFNASASTVTFGTIASYTWDFGDGTAPVTTATATTTHTYVSAGIYTVSLTETSSGGTSTAKVYTGQSMLRNGGGTAYAAGNIQVFTTTAPAVTSISPNTGSQIGGTHVSITGSDFLGATAVRFGSTAAASFSVSSSTQISAVSPPGTGTADVTVTTPAGTSTTNPSDVFTYSAARNLLAYVAMSNSDTVVPIDINTNTAGAPIGVGDMPGPITITPDGQTAFVSNYASGNVTPIDTATNTAGTPISVGEYPTEIAVTPDGTTVFVVNRMGNTIVPFDTATRHAGTPITVPWYANDIAITPDGHTAFALSSSGVTPIDLATRTKGAYFTAPSDGIAIAPDGTTAYTIGYNCGCVTPFNTATHAVGTAIPLGGNPTDIVITPDGKTSYVRIGGAVIPVDLTTKTAGTGIAVAGGGSLAIAPDGKTLYVDSGNTVIPVDLATKSLGTAIGVGGPAGDIAIMPDQAPLAQLSATPAQAWAASSFDASGSTAPYGSVGSYTWHFGDSSPDVTTTTATTTHIYTAPGTYSASVTVAASGGASTSKVFTGHMMLRNGDPHARTQTTVAVAPSSPVLVAYVANHNDNTVTPINMTNNVAGAPIAAGASPQAVAITPDGHTVYVVDYAGTVTPIDTATNLPGAAITIGRFSDAIAITPDGHTAYVANAWDDMVTPIDLTATPPAVGTPIAVGSHPQAIAITPNGHTAYVANGFDNTVSPIDLTATPPGLGTPIAVGSDPNAIAITPDGLTAYVVNGNDASVTPIATAGNTAGTPITVTSSPDAIAITPDGHTAYVAGEFGNRVTPIDTTTNLAGTAITIYYPGYQVGLAVAPDGQTAYVVNSSGNSVSTIDTEYNYSAVKISVGAWPMAMAIMPDQAPEAHLSVVAGAAGSPSSFDASASTVRYGTIATYRWDFGDGTPPVTGGGATTTHVYASPGDYTATLTETSSNGTSTTQVFTGQTVSRNGGPQAQAQARVRVREQGTTTSLVSSANPSVSGQGVTFTATVTAVPPATGTPTGTVQFAIDGVAAGSPVTLSGGQATSGAIGDLSVGAHTVVATYPGDDTFTGSFSPTLTQTVNRASTSTSVASSANPSVFGQGVAFTATVSPVSPGGGTPSGTVQFAVDGSDVGLPVMLSGGQATSVTASNLAVGDHTVTATYGGDGSYTGSSTSPAFTQTVNKSDTSTVVTSSVNPSAFGQSVTFTATVSAVTPPQFDVLAPRLVSVGNNPTGTVQFAADGTNVGSPVTLVGGQATVAIASLTVGSHSMTATYSGDGSYNGSTTSPAFDQTVSQSSTTTGLASSRNPSSFADSVTFTATVSIVAPGAGTATGTVQFAIDGTDVGSPVTLSGGHATLATSTLAVGAHSVTATYAGTANLAGSTSPTLTQTVARSDSLTHIVSSANPSVYGNAVTFTATVTGSPSSKPTPTGTVQFRVDTVAVGSPVSLSGGTATSVAISDMAIGNHTVTATYGGDGSYSGSSASLTQTVSLVPVVTGLSPTSGPFFGAATVTISGHFANVTGVKFGSSAALRYTVDSDTQITAVTPPGSGTVDVTVTSIVGTSTTSAADQYNYVAVAPLGYVANSNGTTVTPFDFTTTPPAVGVPLSVGGYPQSIAITPDGRTAYVGNGYTKVTPIDTASGQVGTAITVGQGVTGIAITPDGRTAYVANNADNTVTPIDVATNHAGTAIPVGWWPVQIAITPDGRTAYVSNSGENTVTPIDVATNHAGTNIIVGWGAMGIAITPDGKTAYVANYYDNTVSPIDVATNHAGTAIPVGNSPNNLAITPDGKTVYVSTEGDYTVTPIDVATNHAGTAISVAAYPAGIAITPGGQTAYVVNYAADGSVVPIDVATNQPGTAFAVGSMPTAIALMPDQAPVAHLSVTPAPAGQASSFDAAASTIPYGSIATYAWSFGDGTPVVTTTTATTTHTYAAAGDYTASVTETSAGGTSTTLVFTGQTVSRNGGPQATAQSSVTIPSSGKQPQTIAFDLSGLPGKSYGDPGFDISGDVSASSGLAVALSSASSGVCTVSGTTVSILAAGTCTIDANQPGDATYDPAPQVSQSFTVGQAYLTITASSPTGVSYGDPAPTITPIYAGWVGSDGPSVLTTAPTCDTTYAYGAPVGDYATSCSGAAAANYEIGYVPGLIHVGPADQVIVVVTAAPATATYGHSFTIDAHASSGLPLSYGSSGSCTNVDATYTMSSGTGSCTVTIDQGGNSNWSAASQVTETVTAQKESQSITFDLSGLPAKHYGDPPFDIGSAVSASSGLAVELSSASTGVCTVSGSTVTIAGAGTCTIDANQPGNDDYSAAAQATQSFTVGAASQTITVNTAAPATATYGHTFTVDASATSGLPVTYGSSGSCSNAGATYTMTSGIGTCTVTFDQAGNDNVGPAPQVSETVAAQKETQSITFDLSGLPAKAYGDLPFDIGSMVSASSGLAVDLRGTTPGVCTLSGSTVTIAGAGACAIVASQAGNDDYGAATAVPQSFDVDQAYLTITASSVGGLHYGDPAPTITPEYSGWVNGDGVSVLTTPPTCGTTYVQGDAAGPYATSCDGAAAANYEVGYVPGLVTVGQATQSITVNTAAPTAATYGHTFTVDASATSGLPVAYGSSGSCSNAGATYTMTSGVGTCTVTLDQAGDGNYYASPQVTETVTAQKETQSITFDLSGLPAKHYGDPSFTISASASSGLAVQFSSATTGVCTVSGSTVSIVAAGTCRVDANQPGDDDYSAAAQVSQSFTVGTATLTVTASSASGLHYGDPVPSITPTYSGWVGSDGPSVLTTAPTCSTVYVQGGTPGAYTSSCSGAAAANYTMHYVNGTVNVGKAPLTVTADNQTVQYGDAPPTLTVHYSGFVLSETPSVLGGTLSCGTSATVTGGKVVSPAGTYSITCSGLTSGNYAITFQPGTLTVARESAVVRLAQNNPHAVQVLTAGSSKGKAPAMTFSVRVTEPSDGSYGDISKATPVTITLSPVGSGSSYSCTGAVTQLQPATATAPGFEVLSCTIVAGTPINVYEVVASVGGTYYQGSDYSVLTVYDPTAGGSDGAGTITNPNTGFSADIAYSATYLKNGKQVQGKYLYIDRDGAANVVHVLKGNAMNTMAISGITATVTGKATLDGVGNYSYIITGIDNGNPNPSSNPDRYGQKILDPSGATVGTLTFNPVTVSINGNIFVGRYS